MYHSYNIQKNLPLTLKAPITTAADDKFCDIFPPNFRKNKVWYYMRIVYQQTILMKYHALLDILKKQQNLKLSSAANYRWLFKCLKLLKMPLDSTS